MRDDFDQLIVDQLPDAVVITTPHGEIVHWSPAAEALFGYRREEAFLPVERRGVSPRHPSGPGAEPAAAPAAAPPPRATVLVVDDSPVNRELLRGTLEPSGYQVWLAEGVGEALGRLAEAVPDLILSDLHMPGEDGIAFVRRVKADPRLAGVPFVFISSSVWGEEQREAAEELGVRRFLLRPIEPRELLEEIAACLGRAGSER